MDPILSVAAVRALPHPIFLDARFRLADPEAGKMLYVEGHIPGALHVDLEKDLSGVKTGSNGRHPLPSRSALRSLFGGLGIGADTPVVCYDDTDHAGAARAWMLLRWMGHERVYVLDGGVKAWDGVLEKGAGAAAGGGAGARAPADFPERTPLVDLVERGQLVGRMLVDARAPERFRGEVEPLDPKAGHIPGARNVFYQSLLREGRFLEAEELRALVPSRDPVFYCGSGVTAAVLLLASARVGSEASVYPGSWSEWSSDPSAPVETGQGSGE